MKFLIWQVACPGQGHGPIECPLASLGAEAVAGVSKRFLHAFGHLRQFNHAKHSGCDWYATNGKYFTERARQELPTYGPIFFCILDAVRKVLGSYGRELMEVVSAADVDKHLAGVVE